MAHMLVKKTKITMKAGDVIFKEHEKGDRMFIIQSGEVEITKKVGGTERSLALFHKGDFFGEMALFGDSIRSATATATQDGSLIVISKGMLDGQMRKVPEWFLVMFKALIARLKNTGQLLKDEIESFEKPNLDKDSEE